MSGSCSSGYCLKLFLCLSSQLCFFGLLKYFFRTFTYVSWLKENYKPWMVNLRRDVIGYEHKVRTYKEYHSVRPSSELGLSQPLSRQRVFPSPQKQVGGGTLACGWGVGGSPNSDEGHTLWYSLYVRTLWIRITKVYAMYLSCTISFCFKRVTACYWPGQAIRVESLYVLV